MRAPKSHPVEVSAPAANTSSGAIASPAVVRGSSLDRDPLKRDFKNFLWKTWQALSFPAPTPLQYDMADWLQYGPDKSILMAFRGAAKSYETVAFCNWCLYRDPDEIVLTVSATNKFAGTNAYFAFTMISQFDWLSHMRPRTDQRMSALGFDVRDAKPKKFESFYADSIFGQITGRRATLVVPDDIEIGRTSDTETKREELRKAAGELGGAILLPGGKVKVLGTAQNENSIYPEFATSKGYGMRMWPILYPKPEERSKFGSYLSPMLDKDLLANPSLAGTSTEPSRFDEADIAGREIEWGRTEFARQFKLWLDAGAGNLAPLKLRDLIVMDWGPPIGPTLKLPPEVRWGPTEANRLIGMDYDALSGDTLHGPSYVTEDPTQWRPTEVLRMYVDPSGSGNDETTWSVGALLNSVVFVCHQGKSMDGHSKTTLDAIARDAKLWGVQYIKVEGNLGQDMFAELLKPCLAAVHHPCTVESEPVGQMQKEVRIIKYLEPPVTSHRVVLNARLLRDDYGVDYKNIADAKQRFYRLTYQFTRITHQKGVIPHDDRVDCLAALVKEFMENLRQRTEDAQKMDKEQALLEEVQHMIDVRASQGLPTFGALPSGQSNFGRPRQGGINASRMIAKRNRRPRP